MEIITCHINADFDAFASMIAAQKFYPSAIPVFSGSVQREVQEFIEEYGVSLVDAQQIDLEKVTRLILVDVKLKERIGRFSVLMEEEGRAHTEIIIFDHHVLPGDDVVADQLILEELGAAVTIFTEKIKAEGVEISPFEATLFCIGVYEETGVLLFPSTTVRDVEAVAYLLSKGADLSAVSRYIRHELEPEQLSLLDELIRNRKEFIISRAKIIFTYADLSVYNYVGDAASVVHKLMELEKIDALFAIFTVDSKVYVISRSRMQWLNVREALAALGGGGHPSAASVAVTGMTPIQVEETILKSVREQLRPKISASDIMTSPVKSVNFDKSIKAAEEIMTKFSVNVLPVIKDDVFAGIITRETVQKSLYLGLAEEQVLKFAELGVKTVFPGDSFYKIESLMIEYNQRFLPVLDSNNKVLGAITRTDLLRTLYEDINPLPDVGLPLETLPLKSRNIKSILYEKIPLERLNIVVKLGFIADKMSVRAYLVGGFVRDLLLSVHNLDIDIVVEGDGIRFAEIAGASLSAKVKSYSRFGTSVLILPDGFKIDIATARTEFYEYPTALPTVEASSIKKDLYRRDFTINTLALSINKSNFGSIVDFFGGQRDLKNKCIKILHNLSFIEDPTRLFRAVRFEQRLNFTIEKHTQTHMKNAVKMDILQRVSGKRLLEEIKLILSEKEPYRMLKRLAQFDLLKYLHPDLQLKSPNIFGSIKEVISWYNLLFLKEKVSIWEVYFLALTDGMEKGAILELFRRLEVPLSLRKKFLEESSSAAVASIKLSSEQPPSPSKIYFILKGMPLEAILFLMAKSRDENIEREISHYLTTLRHIKPDISGDDLKELGIQEGPVYSKIMDAVLNEKLMGNVQNKEDEIKFVKSRFL